MMNEINLWTLAASRWLHQALFIHDEHKSLLVVLPCIPHPAPRARLKTSNVEVNQTPICCDVYMQTPGQVTVCFPHTNWNSKSLFTPSLQSLYTLNVNNETRVSLKASKTMKLSIILYFQKGDGETGGKGACKHITTLHSCPRWIKVCHDMIWETQGSNPNLPWKFTESVTHNFTLIYLTGVLWGKDKNAVSHFGVQIN